VTPNTLLLFFNALQAGAPIPTDPNVYIDPSDEVTVYVGSAGGFKVDDFSISRMLAALVQVRMATQHISYNSKSRMSEHGTEMLSIN